MIFLVIDDSSTQRKIIKQSLKSLGYDNVIEAENGLDGYNKLKDMDVDFVLCDWNMPVLNGLEFVILAKSQDKFKQIPIILVTTKGNTEDILTAMKFKVNGYVVKPFIPEILEKKIRTIIELAGKQSQ